MYWVTHPSRSRQAKTWFSIVQTSCELNLPDQDDVIITVRKNAAQLQTSDGTGANGRSLKSRHPSTIVLHGQSKNKRGHRI